MIEDLILLSGDDIAFPEAQMTIHQPTLKEIGYIGEKTFFTGIQLLNFSKNLLSEEDKVNLESKSNFDIFIAILRERNAVMQKNRNCVMMVLTLLFPKYLAEVTPDAIVFKNVEDQNEIHTINNSNFEIFKTYIKQIFDTGKSEDENGYNPDGELAKKIADKLRKRHQKISESKGEDDENKKVDVLSRQASILAVAEHLDLNSVMNLTMYQLFDQVTRYQLRSGYDIYIQAKMAGAKDMKDPEDWMQDIHCAEFLDKQNN